MYDNNGYERNILLLLLLYQYIVKITTFEFLINHIMHLFNQVDRTSIKNDPIKDNPYCVFVLTNNEQDGHVRFIFHV